LMSEESHGSDADLQEAFTLLEDESRCVAATELLRARILSREEMLSLLPQTGTASSLSFEKFCNIAREKFWQSKAAGCAWRAASRLTSQLSSALASDEIPVSPSGGHSSSPSARRKGQPHFGEPTPGTPVPLPPAQAPNSPQRPRGFRRTLAQMNQQATAGAAGEMSAGEGG